MLKIGYTGNGQKTLQYKRWPITKNERLLFTEQANEGNQINCSGGGTNISEVYLEKLSR